MTPSCCARGGCAPVIGARRIFALWCSLLLCVGAGGGAGLIEAEQQICDGRGRQCAGMEL
jgi:hypothetical protein